MRVSVVLFSFVSLAAAMMIGLAGPSDPSGDPSSGTRGRAGSGIAPAVADSLAEAGVSIARSRDGHFWVDAEVNGRQIRFLVDTGASDVVLTREDADRLGILLQPQDYSLVYRTASGTTRAAPVQLDYVSFGTLHLWNVEAAVNQSNMDVSLLGQSFLSRLSGFEVSGNILTLRP